MSSENYNMCFPHSQSLLLRLAGSPLFQDDFSFKDDHLHLLHRLYALSPVHHSPVL